MAKYYVESGDLRVVVQASNPVPAAAKALSWVNDQDRLDRYVTVNERGFFNDGCSDQSGRCDVILETGTLLALIAEHDFA
jgi:hypothetical protein